MKNISKKIKPREKIIELNKEEKEDEERPSELILEDSKIQSKNIPTEIQQIKDENIKNTIAKSTVISSKKENELGLEVINTTNEQKLSKSENYKFYFFLGNNLFIFSFCMVFLLSLIFLSSSDSLFVLTA